MRAFVVVRLLCFLSGTILRNKLNLGVGYYRIPPYKADSKEGTGSLEQRSKYSSLTSHADMRSMLVILMR